MFKKVITAAVTLLIFGSSLGAVTYIIKKVADTIINMQHYNVYIKPHVLAAMDCGYICQQIDPCHFFTYGEENSSSLYQRCILFIYPTHNDTKFDLSTSSLAVVTIPEDSYAYEKHPPHTLRYEVLNTHASRKEAWSICKFRGAVLASVTYSKTRNEVGKNPGTCQPDMMWISGTLEEDGVWRWANGAVLNNDSPLWGDIEPSGDGNCISLVLDLSGEYVLNDQSCSLRLPCFACEYFV